MLRRLRKRFLGLLNFIRRSLVRRSDFFFFFFLKEVEVCISF